MLADPAFRRAAAAAVALHAVALAWLPSAVEPPALKGQRSTPAFAVRQVLASVDAVAAEPVWSSQGSPAPAREAERLQVVAAQRPAPAPAASAEPTPAQAEPVPPAPLEYLPRSRLTVPPRPVAQVHVPFPPEVKGVVDLRVQIALFIDDAGTVQRVRLDSPNVPPTFAQAIQDTFLATRFTPGEVDRQPVASMIRLEVEFAAGTPR
jgi:hypothetical protein